MLLDTLEPRYGFTQTLSSLGVLTRDDCDEIKHKKSVAKMNMKLLKLLQKKDNVSDFIKFEQALVKTEQQHVLNYLNCNGGEQN